MAHGRGVQGFNVGGAGQGELIPGGRAGKAKWLGLSTSPQHHFAGRAPRADSGKRKQGHSRNDRV